MPRRRLPPSQHARASQSDRTSRLSAVKTISFARGIPGPDLLPIESFGVCAQRAAERDGATALNYGPPGGYAPLRAWIAEQHGVDVDRVVITNGSLQGFNFVARHAAQTGA